jgi:hypothetical protein
MKLFCVVLAPEKTSGFGNQIYTIAQSVQQCIESVDNPYDLILFTSFLKEINSNEYCNLSDVVDINETNNTLKNITNIQIEDFNFENLSILKATIGINNFLLDITPSITDFLNEDNTFFLPSTYNFAAFCDSLVKEIFNKYYVSLDKKTFKLTIAYKINNTIVNKQYDIVNCFLKESLEIDIKKHQQNIINICTMHNDNFYYVKENIVFNKHFSYEVDEFIRGHIESNKKINCIHLRLEDDAIEHWSKENHIDKLIYKRIVENKYLREIQKHIKKEELTLILSHNYDNNVMKYLEENKYNYLTTPSWSTYRDISAIYDCIVGERCNNIYICVWESSFSYLLGYRINKNKNLQNFVTIFYNNISNDELESHSKSI